MRYVGLDVHYRSSTYCILDESGHEVACETIRGHWPKLLARLSEIEGPWAICFEANCGYGYLYRELSRLGARVVVAHPGQLRLIFRAKRKNDRIDARKLAKLLYLDEVPAAYVPHQDVQNWRELIEYRRRTVDRQTTCKNAARSLLRSQGIIAPKGLWTKKGRTWLQSLEMPTPAARLKRDMLLDELDQAKRRVRMVTKELDQIGDRHPAVLLLRTIPGVGIRTGETVAAYLDRAQRFTRSSQVGAYFGLIPCQDASAGSNRLGHITRQGPGTARKYLVEAAWQGVHRSPTIRAYFERVLHGRKERRKIALVATAHYLVRCMYAMLISGRPWQEAA
ncbi:MAG TPA: IS110 family transposase [Phycisphaerales bacterium]|nr:IS110 family transposase [Phycisphaerales bacterium]